MNKPEWFELAEKDGGKTHFEVKRGFRSIALAIPLLAIGAGVVVAQSSDESPANAETATVAIASAAPSITSTVAPTKPSITTPTLPPTGGDDDDEYENDDEGDDD
jgi:hypothetical protein